MASAELRPDVADLSLLSLLAAHELEQIQRSEPSAGYYLAALRERLADQISPPKLADVRNIAPGTVQLYRRAVYEATRIDPPDFQTLSTELGELLRQLNMASKSASGAAKKGPANFAPLLAFIIALHNQLLAQKQRISRSRSHRFRV
ncbi:MAG: hypothetical protein AB7U48_03970 [Bauldia sp.]